MWNFAYLVVVKKFQNEHLQEHNPLGLGIRLGNSGKQGGKGFCPSLLQLRDVGGKFSFPSLKPAVLLGCWWYHSLPDQQHREASGSL